MKTLIGTLTCVPNGNLAGGDAYFIELADDTYEKIIFSHYDQVVFVPYNTKIALCVEEEMDGDAYLVANVKPFFTKVNDNA